MWLGKDLSSLSYQSCDIFMTFSLPPSVSSQQCQSTEVAVTANSESESEKMIFTLLYRRDIREMLVSIKVDCCCRRVCILSVR